MVAGCKGLAIWPVLNPLRFARLAGHHRDCVWRRRRILGRENIIEENEPTGILPKERNGVAIDMRHDETRELRSLRFIRGVAPPRVTVNTAEKKKAAAAANKANKKPSRMLPHAGFSTPPWPPKRSDLIGHLRAAPSLPTPWVPASKSKDLKRDATGSWTLCAD
jgi:hypothetical protein